MVDQTPAARVIVDGLQNGAQDDLNRLLHFASEMCDRLDKGARWMRRIGLLLAIGLVGFLFTAGAWYFKVDHHIAVAEPATAQNTALVSRAIIVLEGLESRMVRVEEYVDRQGE